MRWFQTGDVRADVPLRLHNVDPAIRFWRKVDKSGPLPVQRPELGRCWVYVGHLGATGYGSFRLGKAEVKAHRFAYEAENGPIPEGLEIDHLCRNRACVRPDHLEPTTHAENMRRAYPARTHCKYDHEFTEANTWVAKNGAQRCRECARNRMRKFLERRRRK